MMRITIILLSLLSFIGACNAQEIFDAKFEYEMVINFGSPRTFVSQLYYSKDHSFFEYYDKESSQAKKETKIEQNSDDQLGFTVNYIDSTRFFIDTSSQIASLVRLLEDPEKYYVTIEDIPQIEWVITDEQKKFGNYDCTKANAEFRGRKYTAWFSPEIPINKGPYKFHGLYGLIFEIYDSKREVNFKLLNISFTKQKLDMPDLKKYPKISREDYFKSNKNFLEELISRIASKTDRNFSVEMSSSFRSIEME